MASAEIGSSVSKLVNVDVGGISPEVSHAQNPSIEEYPVNPSPRDVSTSDGKSSAGELDVSLMIETLRNGDRRSVKRALRKLSDRSWTFREEFLKQGGLTPLAEHIRKGRFFSSEPLDLLTALLGSHDESLSEFIEMGGVAGVVRLMKSKWRPLCKAALKVCPVLCSTSEGRQSFCSSGGISSLLRFLAMSHSTMTIAANVMSLLALDAPARKEIIERQGLVALHVVEGPMEVALAATTAIADIIAVEETGQSKMACMDLHKYITMTRSGPKKGDLCAQAVRLLSYTANVQLGCDCIFLSGLDALRSLLDTGHTESEYWALCALESLSKHHRGCHAAYRALTSLVQILLVGDQRCRQKVLSCLQMLAAVDELSRREILFAGALPRLVRELDNGGEFQQPLKIVSLLIEDEDNRSLMVSVIKPLLKLAGSASDQTLVDVVGSLARLSTNDACVSQIVAEGGVSSLVQVMKSGTIEAENWAMKCMALLSHDDGFRSQIQNSDILVTLIEFLQNRPLRTKSIAAICIAKIFDAHPRMKRKFVSLGATEPLLNLLEVEDYGLRGAVLLVLSKISNLQTCKEIICSSDAHIEAMKAILENGSDAVKECIAIIMADVASMSLRGILETGMLHQLTRLLHSRNPSIVANTANALRLVAEKYPPLGLKLTSDPLWGKLLALMKSNDHKVRAMAIACVKAIPAKACTRMNSMPGRSGYVQLVELLISAIQLRQAHCVTEAAAALAAFAEENPPVIQSIIDDQKAIVHLVVLLKHKTGEWHEEAAHAIAVLIQGHENNQLEFAKCHGAVPYLLQIFNNGNLGAKQHCARIIGSLALNPRALGAFDREACIRALIPVLTPGYDLLIDDACNEEICRALANMASRSIQQKVISSEGGIAKLIEQARNASPPAQEHAARALANLSCNDENAKMIGQEGGIEVLAKLVCAENEKCKKQAVGALANLVYKNADNADLLIASGGVQTLIRVIGDDGNECNEHAFRAIGNLASSYSGQIYLANANILPTLVRKFLHPETTAAVHESIVQALSSMVEDNDDAQEEIMASGLVPPLLKMLKVSAGLERDNVIKLLTFLACGGDGSSENVGASSLSSNRAKCAKLMLQEVVAPHKEVVVPELLEVDDVVQGIPKHLICPITHDIMEDPVVASDGHTYDRSAIQQWFRNKASSPMTNQTLRDTALIPNVLVASILEEFVQKSGGWSKFID